MASQVEIANLALGNIRAGSINSFNEDSIEAQVCSQRFEVAVEFLLRDFPWSFANKVAPLSLYSEEPLEWQYAYVYPYDCVNALRIVAKDTISSDRTTWYHYNVTPDEVTQIQDIRKHRIPYDVGLTSTDKKAIYSDEPEAYLAYTAKITDPNLYEPAFIEALSWYLASMIAVPIVGSDKGRELRQDCLKIYIEMLTSAKASNANEAWNTSSIPESPTITARR